MIRRSLLLVIGAALAASAGCRCWDTPCGSAASAPRSSSPYTLTGNSKPICESCYDAVTGVPVPCPPPGSAMVIPGSVRVGPTAQPYAGPSNELPPPSPADMIPPQPGLPYAPPSPAPGLGAGVVPNMAQPVRNGTNK